MDRLLKKGKSPPKMKVGNEMKSINGNQRGAPLSSVWNDDNEPGDHRAQSHKPQQVQGVK